MTPRRASSSWIFTAVNPAVDPARRRSCCGRPAAATPRHDRRCGAAAPPPPPRRRTRRSADRHRRRGPGRASTAASRSGGPSCDPPADNRSIERNPSPPSHNRSTSRTSNTRTSRNAIAALPEPLSGTAASAPSTAPTLVDPEGGPITGAQVVPSHWRNSPQSGPMPLAGDTWVTSGGRQLFVETASKRRSPVRGSGAPGSLISGFR